MSLTDDIRGFLPSASSFHMDVACPGRQNLLRSMREQGIPESDDPGLRELTDRGQRIHTARATGATLPLQQDELAAYKNGLGLEIQFTDQWLQDNALEDYTEAALEERLWLHHPATLTPMLSGQVDIAKLSGRHAAVIDWKSSYAYYVPPSNRSWQLRVYAVLVWREYDGIERIRVAYVMPEKFGEKLDSCDLSLFDLQRIEQEIYQVLWRSQQADAELRAGSHCRFCAARGQCPAAASMATLPAVTGTGVSDPFALVQAMRPKDLATVWKRKALVTQIFDAITQRLSALSDEELGEIGLKRTKGKKLDKIKDVAGAYAKLAGQGLSEPDLLQAMTFNKERLVQLLARDRNCREERAAEIWSEMLDEFIERGRGNPSLVESKP